MRRRFDCGIRFAEFERSATSNLERAKGRAVRLHAIEGDVEREPYCVVALIAEFVLRNLGAQPPQTWKKRGGELCAYRQLREMFSGSRIA